MDWSLRFTERISKHENYIWWKKLKTDNPLRKVLRKAENHV